MHISFMIPVSDKATMSSIWNILESSLKCNYCTSIIPGIEAILSHYSSEHGLNYKRTLKVNVTTNFLSYWFLQEFSCSLCSVRKRQLGRLLRHLMSEHGLEEKDAGEAVRICVEKVLPSIRSPHLNLSDSPI